MSKAYDPSARSNNMQVLYKVKTAGDRWFIPYNDNDTTANQVTRCTTMVGKTTNGSTNAGAESVA